MPDHFPLKDEIWVEREASPRGKESTPDRIDVAMDSRGNIAASRVKVLGVHRNDVTFMMPGNETGHSGGENVKTIKKFTAKYTYQNPHEHPQRGSLWIRNNIEMPANTTPESYRELGMGRFDTNTNVVLFVVKGINTTQYDLDGTQFSAGLPEGDTCTVRIYNTDDKEDPTSGFSNVQWAGGINIPVPYIKKEYLSYSSQGGTSDQGQLIGWRVRRFVLSQYYTFVGFAPEYLDTIPRMSNTNAADRWKPREYRIPRVGQIFKVKNGDKTHGQMVVAVSWSRDKRDNHAFAEYPIHRMGYPRTDSDRIRRGPCTRFTPMYVMFGIKTWDPSSDPHHGQRNQAELDDLHYPEDKPTFIVTTVQVFKWKWDYYMYWGDRGALWEISEFDKELELDKEQTGNHIERYRKMIRNATGVPNPAPSNYVSNNTSWPTMEEQNYKLPKRSGTWDDEALRVSRFGGGQLPRIMEMFKTWDGDTVKVVAIYKPEQINSPNHEKKITIWTYSEEGVKRGWVGEDAMNFYVYHTELTSLSKDIATFGKYITHSAKKEFNDSLVYTDWEIRKHHNKPGYIMALPSNEEAPNAMLWLEGPLILLNEFRRMINNPALQGRAKPRTRDGYDAAILELIPKPAPPNNGRVRPCEHKLITTKGYIRKDPWRHTSQTPKAFYEYDLPNTSPEQLTVGSKYRWVKDDMDSIKQNGRTQPLQMPGGCPSINEIVVLGPAFSFHHGMQLDDTNKQYSVWVQNPSHNDDCGVYKMPVAFLLSSYRPGSNRTDGFSVVNIPKAVVLNLCCIASDSYQARERAQFINYDAYQVILPPNLELYKWPKTGETWHHKIVPQLPYGPAPNNKYIGRTRNMGFDIRRSDENALNYVSWPLLSDDSKRNYIRCISHYTHYSETGFLYPFLGDYSQRITEDMSWEHKFQLFMRAKVFRVEMGNVFLNWNTGRLYSVTGISVSTSGQRESYRFEVLHKPTYYAFNDTPSIRKDPWQLDIKTNQVWLSGMIFFGHENFNHWRDIDKPIIGSTYKLRPTRLHTDWRMARGGMWPEGRPRAGPDVAKKYNRKLFNLRRKVGINLNDGSDAGPRNEVVILDTFSENDRVYVQFKFLLKGGEGPEMTMTELDFYYLFVWERAEVGRDQIFAELKSHPTFKQEREAAMARNRNKESNRARAVRGALDRKEYTCMVCFESTTDPSGYVHNSENGQPQGYLFTHDHDSLSEPHIICGLCALQFLKLDGSSSGSRDIAPNASDDFVKGAAMGARDNNGFPVGPIQPYRIKCPQCGLYYHWRRLERLLKRNQSRGSSKRDRQGGEVWGELNKLTLKF